MTNIVLEQGKTYHIYNRAIGKEKLFLERGDYFDFLKKLRKYVLPISSIYAYCLLPNHFHLMVKFEKKELKKPIHQYFSNLFNAYTKRFNLIHRRKGGLFIRPFKRKLVSDDIYFTKLIHYIHANPVHHGLTTSLAEWPYNSYSEFLEQKNDLVNVETVTNWFGGLKEFEQFHREIKIGLKKDGVYIE